MPRSNTKKKGSLTKTEKSPAVVHAEEFLAQVFHTNMWDHLFPCPLLPNMLSFRPNVVIEGLGEICEGDTEVVMFLEKKTGSIVTIGVRKEPIVGFDFWNPSSIKMDLVVHNKQLAQEYNTRRLLVEATKVEEKVE